MSRTQTLIKRLLPVAILGLLPFAAHGEEDQDANCFRYAGQCIYPLDVEKKLTRKKVPARVRVVAGMGKLHGISNFRDVNVYEGGIRYYMGDGMEIPVSVSYLEETADRDRTNAYVNGHSFNTGVIFNLRLNRFIKIPVGTQVGYTQYKVAYDGLHKEVEYVQGTPHVTPFTGVKVTPFAALQLEFQAGLPFQHERLKGQEYQDFDHGGGVALQASNADTRAEPRTQTMFMLMGTWAL